MIVTSTNSEWLMPGDASEGAAAVALIQQDLAMGPG
jgi:hypothetical protein